MRVQFVHTVLLLSIFAFGRTLAAQSPPDNLISPDVSPEAQAVEEQVGSAAPPVEANPAPKADEPQPDDLRVIRTECFELRIPYSDSYTRDEARELVTEAVKYVESRFPKYKGFKEINERYKVAIIVERVLKRRVTRTNDGAVQAKDDFEALCGQCELFNDQINVRVTGASLRDKETLVHELVHAILRGNDVEICNLIDEGLARYVEDREGKCPAIRNFLIERGVLAKQVLHDKLSDCHTGACGWIIVKHLVEIDGKSLEEVAGMQWAQLPEPRDALLSFISWDAKPVKPSLAEVAN